MILCIGFSLSGCALKSPWPPFHAERVAELDFPYSWENSDLPFSQWREKARAKFLEHLGPAPGKVPFDVRVVGSQDRDSYTANKINLTINKYERINAYLLVPKGQGPFPAMIALHDHGAHFYIGKEKVVRPFDEEKAVVRDAVKWAKEYYGGVFIGDALAQRGYVVFAMDVQPWGERGGRDANLDKNWLGRKLFATNMNQLGFTWAGYNVWDDIRSAEFIQSLPEVAPERIGCIGLSMGANRTWQLNAATDIVKAGAAICWMDDTKSLANPKFKFTVGFSMLHPGLINYMENPDVASIACPKPMLFFNGTEDRLFSIEGVNRCYAKMRKVWESQDAGDKLICKWWDQPHVFNREMQREAFDWLDKYLKN